MTGPMPSVDGATRRSPSLATPRPIDGGTRASYAGAMANEHLIQQALARPLSERVALAETLWQSIIAEPKVDAADDERSAVEMATRRDAEPASGAVIL